MRGGPSLAAWRTRAGLGFWQVLEVEALQPHRLTCACCPRPRHATVPCALRPGEAGLVDIRSTDWSEEVAPFWGAVIRSALTGRGVAGLLKAGWTTIKAALVMPLMQQGFRMGLIKFVLITATQP